MKNTLNLALFCLLITIVLLTWFLRRDYTNRNEEFLPGMVNSVPFDALSENPNFPDGKTLRSPAAGTASSMFVPLHYRPVAEDAKRAGDELVNPIPDTLVAEMDRGAIVFATFCQPCHGAGAIGDGSVVKRGFPPPPSLLADKARNLKDGQMFHILTYGQNNMPSLASQVVRPDRWRVINYVRSLQKKNRTVVGQ
jgi:mono/diheme cytochrome c family protein